VPLADFWAAGANCAKPSVCFLAATAVCQPRARCCTPPAGPAPGAVCWPQTVVGSAGCR